ncbi:DUF5681 domain-containing protein [Bradyrhizobium sp. Ec3.3]|uniref:DUF5681 domain-containing protein n=1 Tax=Bradyrhizobium sp. Ec3.3 TaxID=189753 RepID=UPI0004174D88|nr:DUF5681 domain-containing protein [Bradyrhizobium sp. Ec3.3]
MSRKRPRRADTSGTKDGVGYCTPPPEHWFKPGQSGNPKGRPKGSKNEATIINEILARKITVRENGRARKITVQEAILLNFANDALKGNPKSATFLLNRKQLIESSEQPKTPVLDMDDRKILEFYARQLEEQLKKKEEPE